MRTVMIVIAALGIAGTAKAEGIVEACEHVAALEFGVNAVTSSDVQAFPELNPPRVRMRVHGPRGSSGFASDAIAGLLSGERRDADAMHDYGQVRCEFETANRPYGLRAFDCAGMSCFISESRLEELQTLMQRDGY